MLQYKIFAAIFLAVFLVVQLFLIKNEFAGTRAIEIKMKRYRDSTVYIKGYQPEGVPVDQFMIKVQPKSFWDYLLLTNTDGNLLTIFFKIAAATAFTWFVFNLSYSSLFSKKSFYIMGLTMALVGGILVAHSYGLSHTLQFWDKLYAANGGSHGSKFQLYVDDKYNLNYYAIPVIFILSLYRYFIAQHEKRSENLMEVE